MKEGIFEIAAPGLDVKALVSEIQQTVDRKQKEGAYTDARVARAERSNLANLRQEEGFVSFYLECLREAVFVDISDFEIVEKRRKYAGILVPLKRLIWNMLKFYTYRLWSQQNQVNGLLMSAVDSMETAYRARISALEQRIKDLESRRPPAS
jgi:hypothetical protein